MVLKWILLLSYFVASSTGSCLTGSINCHEAASCQNVSGVPTCVCDPWYIGDGVKTCYGFCNQRSCAQDQTGSCRTNALGYTCLCLSPSADCPTAPPPPKNIQVTWKSATSLTFAWNYVQHGYLFRSTLSNISWTSRTYSSYVPVAGFDGLATHSLYNFSVATTEPSSFSSDEYLENTLTNILTADESSSSSKASGTEICDNPEGCKAKTNECQLGTHRCHTEASCTDTRRGYRCECNHGYVGNGTHCVGVCETCRDGNCLPNQFGSTCFCRSKTPQCSVPTRPTGLQLIEQHTTWLVFEWHSAQNVASYSVTLTRSNRPNFRVQNYRTVKPTAAFTNLFPGTKYTVSVVASNPRGSNAKPLSFETATVIADGPAVTVLQESRSSIRVKYPIVDHAQSYEIVYFTDPLQKYYLNTTENSVLIENLTTKMEYKVQVFVNYVLAKSSGNNVSTIFLADICGRQICHEHANCSRANTCVCEAGYLGNGIECQEFFGVPFRVRLSPSNTTSYVIRNLLEGIFIRTPQYVDDSFGLIKDGFVNFTVFTTNENISFNLPNNSNVFAGKLEPLKDVCLSQQVFEFHFNESSAGDVQESRETCSDGSPIASVLCSPQSVLDSSTGAFRLGSRFMESNLNVKTCPNIEDVVFNLTVVDIEVPLEAIEQALEQLNISGITPTVSLTQGNAIREMFPSDANVSVVITIDIGENTTIQNLQRPVRIANVFENTVYGQTESLTALVNTQVVQKCVFWDEKTETWSGEGCCLNNYLSPPTCECNHLTSFAILVSSTEVPANLALIVVSDIGCALSIIGLAATFFTLLLNREARVKIPNIIQMHFTCTLFLTYIIFLFGVTKIENYAFCTFVTALLHYIFLVSWVWIAVYSNRLYVALANVFHQTGPNFIKKACFFSYGLPLVIVGFNVGITVGYFDQTHRDEELCNPDDPITTFSYYRAQNMCWLSNYSLYYGFLIIVGIVLLHNIVVLVLVSKKLFQKQNIRSTRAKRSKVSDCLSAIGLSFTLGITWLFGFLMLLSKDVTYNLVMSWLFAIFTASQGFAIWYVTCVRRKDMRQFWWHPVKNVFIKVAVKVCCYQPPVKPTTAIDRNSSTGATYSITYFKSEST